MLTMHKYVKAIAGLMATFVVLIVLTMFRSSGARPFDPGEFLDFMSDADHFQREYLGCPPKGYPPDIECVVGAGSFDYKLWMSMKKRAAKLFAE